MSVGPIKEAVYGRTPLIPFTTSHGSWAAVRPSFLSPSYDVEFCLLLRFWFKSNIIVTRQRDVTEVSPSSSGLNFLFLPRVNERAPTGIIPRAPCGNQRGRKVTLLGNLLCCCLILMFLTASGKHSEKNKVAKVCRENVEWTETKI